jgi:hypothetical protein
MRVGLDFRHRGASEQRQVVLVAGLLQRLHGPERIAAAQTQRVESIGMGECLQRLGRQMGAQPEIADGIEARAADAFDGPGPILGEAVDLAKAETQRVFRLDVLLH